MGESQKWKPTEQALLLSSMYVCDYWWKLHINPIVDCGLRITTD
jgi:hypothetical protein